jgi:hypothetical protein
VLLLLLLLLLHAMCVCRWGWEQLWNIPTGGASFTEAGSMYCGQVRQKMLNMTAGACAKIWHLHIACCHADLASGAG